MTLRKFYIICTKVISFDDNCQTPFLKVKSQKKGDRKEKGKRPGQLASGSQCEIVLAAAICIKEKKGV